MDDDYDFIIILNESRRIPTKDHHRMAYFSVAFLSLSLSQTHAIIRPVSRWDIPLILMTIKPFFYSLMLWSRHFVLWPISFFGGSNPYVAYANIKHGCAQSLLDVRVSFSPWIRVYFRSRPIACYLFKIEYFPHLSLMMSKNCTFFSSIFISVSYGRRWRHRRA